MVETITDPDNGVTTYDYDNDHPTWLTNVTHPNGATAVYVPDKDGRIIGVTNTEAPGGAIIDLLTYNWDSNSSSSDGTSALRQDMSAPLLNRKTKYTYNSDNRLTNVNTETLTPAGSTTTPTWVFAYDPVGNRTSSSLNGATSSFTYNNANELSSGGVLHDDNGNMTNGGAHGFGSMTYNIFDQTTPHTPKVPGASRTETYAGTSQSTWLSSGDLKHTNAASLGITATTNQTTSATTTFVRDPSGRLVSMERGGDRYYYHYDGRGSVSALSDENGDKNQAYTYEPYGRLVSKISGGVDQPFRWNSEYALNDYDYKIGARWYDASLGRWTQRDPSGQDANPYAFSDNDPINKSDPTGLFPWGDCALPGDDGDNGCEGGDINEVNAFEDAADSNSDIGSGLKNWATGEVAGFFVTTTCAAGVIGFTGGIGTPGLVGCKVAGSAAGNLVS